MKASLELLYHFRCELDPYHWWAIADFTWSADKTLWCPHCGHQMQLPEKPLTGRDFLAEKEAATPEPETLP